jgi:6-phospho-beta-glucosidase
LARIKLAYIGGGSTRAPGTMASLLHQGSNFNGSHVVLIDLDEERLALVQKISEKLIAHEGLDITMSATTNRKEGLRDCDAVLTSFRSGGFEARYLDESIPLKHGVIGQETQGPGGFFMALRSIKVMQQIVADIEEVCPGVWIFNYTNPVNIVSQAITRHTDAKIVSLCEGPIIFPRGIARAAGLDPDKVDAVMVGLNHACWSTRHLYDGGDMMPLVGAAVERMTNDPDANQHALRLLRLASTMGSLPADYFQYYYFTDEILDELRAKPTTRSQDIIARVPDYWQHYREQADEDVPALDPNRSRGGIHELELAIDVMDAIYNDRREVLPVNVVNNGALPGLGNDLVVELLGYVGSHGITPLASPPLPPQVRGLVEQLGEYQSLAADAAWHGSRRDAIRALVSNPLVRTLDKAERLFVEMAAAHRAYLPDRLLA